jgi:CHASE2 domain-containing sensor protein
MPHAPIWIRALRLVLRPLAWLSERLGSRFYPGLAAAVVAVSVYAIGADVGGAMEHRAYDFIVRSRFRVPPPDPDIVLVDIDEASLAAMAPEYGRWPWPRAVMAELAEGILRQGPAAVVFDITFTDLDVDRPEADRYLREVAARYPETFFAMVRLNPANDRLSELRLAELAGVRPLAHAQPQATVAMLVPYFRDVLDGRRLGTINLHADDDGIVRSYPLYRDVGGWRIHSLPANVVAALGGTLPARPDILLNWRAPPPAYRTMSFYPLYRSLLRRDGARAIDELAGRIVVVGSTAPSLFDIKPTPVARAHPGVEVLMTALDNLKNGDYLTPLPPWVYMLVSGVAVALLAAAFVYNVDWLWLRTLFTVMQIGFLALTYLFLNFSTWFVNLTAPFTAAFAYFLVASFYSRALVLRRNGHPWYSPALDPGRTSQVLLLACRVSAPAPRRRARLHALLQREAGRTRYGAAAPRLFAAAPLVQTLYEDTELFYWLVPAERACAALADLTAMLERVLARVRGPGREPGLQFALHAVRFTVDDRGHWRTAGREAVRTVLELVQQPLRGRLVRSDAFAHVLAACKDVAIAPVLARAGLHRGSELPGG